MGHHDLPAGLAEYYHQAQQALTPSLAAYFLGGAGAEATVADNEGAFEIARVVPRHLRDLRQGSTAVDLLGERYDTPILVAPFAYQKLLHNDSERGTAQGAAAQSIPMVLSAQSSTSLKSVRDAAPESHWFQLYWLANRDATLALAHRALKAGYTRLILTIDAPVQGVRDREIASGFSLPANIHAVNLVGLPQPVLPPLSEGQSAIFDGIARILPRWEDVAWLCNQLPVPVILKGILHPDDARMAQQVGAAGIIVSNHGGRVLDRAPSSLSMLSDVVGAVGPDYPVLFDGGIRRGVDVLIALALGASAVLVGRPALCGLTVGGAVGVSHVLRLLRDELEIAMLLTGCRTITDITPKVVHLNR